MVLPLGVMWRFKGFGRTGNTEWNSLFRCYRRPFQVSKYRIQYRYRYWYRTDDTKWFFSVSLNLPRQQRIFTIHMSDRGIRHYINNPWQVLPLSVRHCSWLLRNTKFLFTLPSLTHWSVEYQKSGAWHAVCKTSDTRKLFKIRRQVLRKRLSGEGTYLTYR